MAVRATEPGGGSAIAKILFSWELGGGSGHLTRIAPVARELARRGHQVVALVRDPSRARGILGDLPYREAPTHRPEGASRFGPIRSFADILDRSGWGEAAVLEPLVAAWRREIRSEGADVIVMDHSPTALLACQGERVRRVLLGTGFACPPDVEPLPDLRPEPEPQSGPDPVECRVRDVASDCLTAVGEPTLGRLASLYGRVDACLLATWPEFDHYGERPGADYMGVWPGQWGSPPEWPEGEGERVFAYLKPFRALPALVRMLDRAGLPSLIHLDGVAPDKARGLESAHVRVVLEPVHLERAARECEIAVLNASHGTTAAVLLVGRPILAIPLHHEQFLVARRVVRAGAGQIASGDAPDQIANGLRRLLGDLRFRSAAAAIAERYVDFDADAAVTRVADRIEALAGEPSGG